MTPEKFAPHGAEIRARICRTVGALGAAIEALENLELALGWPNHGEPVADLALADYHLEEMLQLLDTAGDHLTSVGDAAERVPLAASAAVEAEEDAPDNGASYRVRGQGGAS